MKGQRRDEVSGVGRCSQPGEAQRRHHDVKCQFLKRFKAELKSMEGDF